MSFELKAKQILFATATSLDNFVIPGLDAGEYSKAPMALFDTRYATAAQLTSGLAGKVGTGDSRLTDARTPTGGAGGVLSGTFPNPGFAADMATQSELEAGLATKVPTSRTVNGNELSADINLTKNDIGLGSVDNTADTAKPISTATQTALDAKASTAALAAKANLAGGNTFTDAQVINGTLTIQALGYPQASIRSTTNANYGIGFNGGAVNFIANNQEAAAATFGNIGGTNRPSLGVTALLLTGFSSAPSGTGYAGAAMLSSFAAHEVTMGFTQTSTKADQKLKAHDSATAPIAANLTVAGGNATVSGDGGSVFIAGGSGVTNGSVYISGRNFLANVEGDADIISGGNLSLVATGNVHVQGANRAPYSVDPSDITACLVSHGLMSPS